MNGISYLLDTNIIIGLYEHNQSILELLQIKQISIKECAYSSITRMQLLSYPALTPMDKQSIETLLMRMVYLAITPAIENETIEFRSRYRLKLPDSIIAATAKQHQLELLSLDKKLVGKLG